MKQESSHPTELINLTAQAIEVRRVVNDPETAKTMKEENPTETKDLMADQMDVRDSLRLVVRAG